MTSYGLRFKSRTQLYSIIIFGAILCYIIFRGWIWSQRYGAPQNFTINDDGSVTFWPTPDLKPSTEQLPMIEIPMEDAMRAARGCVKLEASSDRTVKVVQTDGAYPGISSFITAALTAWSKHYPFRFKPEHIWLMILQGTSVHVEQNAEKLRKKYVNHEGKMTLNVNRDDFVLGSDKNDWEGVIEEFVDQIDANTVKDTVQLFDCDFSGSTMMEKICTKVTIMDICKKYFKYDVITMCGFPEITLDGTKSDWIKLKQKTSVLLNEKVDKEFGSGWGSALLPLLDRFIATFDGEIDGLFWNSMIKRGADKGSGGFDYFSGWINILFPFRSDEKRNTYCVPYSTDHAYVKQGLNFSRESGFTEIDGLFGYYDEHGGDITAYPPGLSQAPVTWKYYGKEMELKFVAGFIGFKQDPKSLEICPNLGWFIAHRNRIIYQPINAYSRMTDKISVNSTSDNKIITNYGRRWA